MIDMADSASKPRVRVHVERKQTFTPLIAEHPSGRQNRRDDRKTIENLNLWPGHRLGSLPRTREQHSICFPPPTNASTKNRQAALTDTHYILYQQIWHVFRQIRPTPHPQHRKRLILNISIQNEFTVTSIISCIQNLYNQT
jgi:hypothetical protein